MLTINQKKIILKGLTFTVGLCKDEPLIQEVKALDDQFIGNHAPVSLKRLIEIANNDGLLVALHQNKLAAYSLILFDSSGIKGELNENEALFYGTAVKPSFRNIGLGSAMAREQERVALKKGYLKFILSVRPENAAAVLLRLKLGYHISDFDQNYFGQGKARLLMKKATINTNQNSSKQGIPAGRVSFQHNKSLEQGSLMMLILAFGAQLYVSKYQLDENGTVLMEFMRENKT
jgi:ribosomal protein S18 acetylase RimI-like enzyme